MEYWRNSLFKYSKWLLFYLLRMVMCWHLQDHNRIHLVQSTAKILRKKTIIVKNTSVKNYLNMKSFGDWVYRERSQKSFSNNALTLNTEVRFVEKSAEERPWLTSLFHSMAWSRFSAFKTYTIGANVSLCTTSASCGKLVIIVGST